MKLVFCGIAFIGLTFGCKTIEVANTSEVSSGNSEKKHPRTYTDPTELGYLMKHHVLSTTRGKIDDLEAVCGFQRNRIVSVESNDTFFIMSGVSGFKSFGWAPRTCVLNGGKATFSISWPDNALDVEGCPKISEDTVTLPLVEPQIAFSPVMDCGLEPYLESFATRDLDREYYKKQITGEYSKYVVKIKRGLFEKIFNEVKWVPCSADPKFTMGRGIWKGPDLEADSKIKKELYDGDEVMLSPHKTIPDALFEESVPCWYPGEHFEKVR